MTFVDPGAKELIDKLTLRVEALERQMAAVAQQLGIAAPGGVAPVTSQEDAGADEALALLRAGKTIDAIAAYRQRTGAGLGEAKDAIDRLKREHGL